MRLNFNIVVIFFFFIFLSCNNKKIEFEILNPIIDLGKLNASDEAIGVFQIKNIGNSNIIIDKITTDCHCTLVDNNEKTIINPHSIFKLNVSYDKSSFGFFEQKITVFYNDSNQPNSLLILRGNILR